jgi:hypothetical protein
VLNNFTPAAILRSWLTLDVYCGNAFLVTFHVGD